MQPQSPNKDFDFMLKEQPQRRRILPSFNLSKPIKIALAVVLAIVFLIVISSVLSGRKAGKTQPFIGVLARGQETLRVTAEVQQLQLQDPQTQAMASTAASALASDKQQLLNYLARNHSKVSAAALGADNDKTSDASLQAAAQNNGLDSAYVTYLRDSLNKYETDIQTAYKTAGPNGQKLLNDISISTTTLLNSPPLKS
jgi:hypothetical protein